MAHTLRAALLLSFAVLLTLVEGATNVIVDDNYDSSVLGHNLQYFQSTNGNGWSQGNNCSACQLNVDAAQAFDGTWHDVTFFPGEGERTGFTLTFNGMPSSIHSFDRVTETPS